MAKTTRPLEPGNQEALSQSATNPLLVLFVAIAKFYNSPQIAISVGLGKSTYITSKVSMEKRRSKYHAIYQQQIVEVRKIYGNFGLYLSVSWMELEKK